MAALFGLRDPEDEGRKTLRNGVNIYPVTQCDIPEGSDLQQHRSENLKLHFMT